MFDNISGAHMQYDGFAIQGDCGKSSFLWILHISRALSNSQVSAHIRGYLTSQKLSCSSNILVFDFQHANPPSNQT